MEENKETIFVEEEEKELGLAQESVDHNKIRRDLKSIFFINKMTYMQLAECSGVSYPSMRRFLREGKKLNDVCLYRIKIFVEKQKEANSENNVNRKSIEPNSVIKIKDEHEKITTLKANRIDERLSNFKCNIINK